MVSPVSPNRHEASQSVPYTYKLEKGWLFHTLKVLDSKSNVVHSFSLPWIKFYNPFIKVSKDEDKGNIKDLVAGNPLLRPIPHHKNGTWDPIKNILWRVFGTRDKKEGFHISKKDLPKFKQLQLESEYPGIIEECKQKIGKTEFNKLSVEEQNKEIANFIKSNPDLAANLELQGRYPGIIEKTKAAITEGKFSGLPLPEQNKEIRALIEQEELEARYPGIIEETKAAINEITFNSLVLSEQNKEIKESLKDLERLRRENPQIKELYEELYGADIQELSWHDRSEKYMEFERKLNEASIGSSSIQVEINGKTYSLEKKLGKDSIGYSIRYSIIGDEDSRRRRD